MARVALIVDEMFEDSELRVPFDRLKEAGHEVTVVGLEAGKELCGKRGNERISTEIAIGDVTAEQFDALVIPGGWAPDRLRRLPEVLELVRDFDRAKKPIAMICHAGWVPISARILSGRQVTGVSAIRDDLENAGARFVDRSVVVDGHLISSRTPADLPDFCRELIAALRAKVTV